MNIFKYVKKTSRPRPPIPKAVFYNPLYFIAFGFGSGLSPIMPGTVGTLFAIPFYLWFRTYSLTTYLIIVVAAIFFSSMLSDYISKKTNTHDHPGMCIDEFVGFFVTMINAPHAPIWIVIGFLLFRLFDIWKPWPISVIDKNMDSGFGMVFDDVVAGLFSLLIIQGLALFIGH